MPAAIRTISRSPGEHGSAPASSALQAAAKSTAATSWPRNTSQRTSTATRQKSLPQQPGPVPDQHSAAASVGSQPRAHARTAAARSSKQVVCPVIHALGPGPGAGKALRPVPVPAGPLGADLLRPGHLHPQPGLRCSLPNADISKATQNREPIAFCDHWKQVSGHDPKMLIMDQKVTTQAILGELDARGVKFATLRMRSASLMNRINSLTSTDYKTITLDRPGPNNRPSVHEDPAVKLTSYPGTVRQLIVTGLGRDAPTVIITNDDHIKTRALISQYARRMTIEQRLAEIIGAFCADALSSTVNLNVDLDVVLCVLAQALLAAFRTRLGPGYATATPDTIQRRSPHRRNHHHRRRHHHRHPQPPRPLTRPAPVRPPRPHHHPLVAKPPPPLPVQLAGGAIRCMEIRVSARVIRAALCPASRCANIHRTTGAATGQVPAGGPGIPTPRAPCSDAAPHRRAGTRTAVGRPGTGPAPGSAPPCGADPDWSG